MARRTGKGAGYTIFTAIDFETADHGRDSACAVEALVVEGGRIIERLHRLIGPLTQFRP